MTPDEHQMLVQMKILAEDNAKMLKSIQRMHRTSMAIKAIYWVVVLGISFGAFYLIQPYFDALKGGLGDTSGSSTNAFEEALKGL